MPCQSKMMQQIVMRRVRCRLIVGSNHRLLQKNTDLIARTIPRWRETAHVKAALVYYPKVKSSYPPLLTSLGPKWCPVRGERDNFTEIVGERCVRRPNVLAVTLSFG